METCSHVFVRSPSNRKSLQQPYEGPYEVLEQISENIYKVDIKGQSQTINVSRIKPAYIEEISEEINKNKPLRIYSGSKTLLRQSFLKGGNVATTEKKVTFVN